LVDPPIRGLHPPPTANPPRRGGALALCPRRCASRPRIALAPSQSDGIPIAGGGSPRIIANTCSPVAARRVSASPPRPLIRRAAAASIGGFSHTGVTPPPTANPPRRGGALALCSRRCASRPRIALVFASSQSDGIPIAGGGSPRTIRHTHVPPSLSDGLAHLHPGR